MHRELTQEAAAGALGIDRSMLSKVENRKAQFTQRLLDDAAALYGCTPRDLLSVNPLVGADPVSVLTRELDGASPDDIALIRDLALRVLKK